LKPFKFQARQNFGSHLKSLKIVSKRYNSPVDWPRAVVPNLFYAVAHLSLPAERRGPPSQNS